MKITGTRSYIIVEFDYRRVKIHGELTTAPAFYASIKSIINWESPYENIPVTDMEKQEIVKRVNASGNVGLKIIFDE